MFRAGPRWVGLPHAIEIVVIVNILLCMLTVVTITILELKCFMDDVHCYSDNDNDMIMITTVSMHELDPPQARSCNQHYFIVVVIVLPLSCFFR